MKTKYPQLTSRKCYKCGKNMLLMSVTIEKVPLQHSPVTTAIYKCSDPVCREESEKDMARVVKRRQDQEAVREKRLNSAKKKKTQETTTAKKK